MRKTVEALKVCLCYWILVRTRNSWKFETIIYDSFVIKRKKQNNQTVGYPDGRWSKMKPEFDKTLVSFGDFFNLEMPNVNK